MLMRAASFVTTVALVAGLVWWVLEPTAAAGLLLSVGLVVLLVTPVAQIVGAVAEEIQSGEWRFALVGVGVLLLLAVSTFVSLWR